MLTTSLSGNKAVSNGRAGAANIVGIELRVVGNYVEMDFRTDEETPPKIIADAAADVGHEMVGAKRRCARRKISTASAEVVVEDYIFHAQASHKLGFGPLAGWSHIDRIDVGEYRTKILEAVVKPLSSSDRDFRVYAEAVLPSEKNISADAGVQSALFRWRHEPLRGAIGCGGINGTGAGREVNLLGMDKSSDRKEQTYECKQREFSQYSPLVASFRRSRLSPRKIGGVVKLKPQPQNPSPADWVSPRRIQHGCRWRQPC